MPVERKSSIGRRTRNSQRINRLRVDASQRRAHTPQEEFENQIPERFRREANEQPNYLGRMDSICEWCRAYKFRSENEGMCCLKGKIQLQPIGESPEPLRSLLNGEHPLSRDFTANIRAYNNAFQMTSFKAQQVREPGFMPTFKVQGQIYHIIGSVLPANNETSPRFLQVYFISNMEEQVRARIEHHPLNANIVREIQYTLHQVNPYIRDFKMALENAQNIPDLRLVIHADRRPAGEHLRRFNAPQTNEVAVLLVGQQFSNRDIVLQTRTNETQIISDFHRSYDALQYPLMFIRGEDGYTISIPQINPATGQPIPNKSVSCMNFYCYHMMVREDSPNTIHQFRMLTNQFWVDMYVKIETERLNYIRLNQGRLRAENYQHLRDALEADEPEGVANVGQRIILPSTFVGSPRYMHERTQDALTYVRHYGRPDLFITFTCNPKWTEIQENLFPNQQATDRYDIVSRIFQLKVKALLNLLTKDNLFGAVRCYMYTVEWQKRGLPHIHLLLWLHENIQPEHIDHVICAQIPDNEHDPHLYNLVKTHMIHGPCGPQFPTSPCMVDGRCSKRYPKSSQETTTINNDGYARYKRPRDGRFVDTRDARLDNTFVVPYNPVLLKIFNAHINVEFCTNIKSIKYVCKYINKGSDQATFSLNTNDEIKTYVTGRYISTSEAVWRTLSFDIHQRSPTIVHLVVHLENGQRIYFTDDQNAQAQIQNPKDSTLTAFFKLCAQDEFARTLTYDQVPAYYTWNERTRCWDRRRRGFILPDWPDIRKSDALARVYSVHPSNTECFHLRILLHHVTGPTSFQNIRTVQGVVCPTFQTACKHLGLLEDNDQWQKTLQEAAIQRSPSTLRYLFATLLIFCQVEDPLHLWNLHKQDLSQDILHRVRLAHNNMDLQYNEAVYNEALTHLQSIVTRISPGKTLADFQLPSPDEGNVAILPSIPNNINLTPALDQLTTFEIVERDERLLNPQQNLVYNEIMQSVVSDNGNLYFLDAPGGTGKTFLLNLFINKTKCLNLNVLAVASSGIAATLLQDGKTAHSAFKIPLNIINNDDTPVMCNISKQSDIAKQMQECHLCLWDEATMANKVAIEAVDRTLRDLRNCPDKPMGGLTFLFAGDFRQTLPVVPKGTRADEFNACLKNSYLWNHIRKLQLTTNMRVQIANDDQMAHFADLLLQLGNGEIPTSPDGMISVEAVRLCKTTTDLNSLINTIYPSMEQIGQRPLEWFAERAILAARNKHVDEINQQLMNSYIGRQQTYFSVNNPVNPEDAVLYPPEFLNCLDMAGLPLHKLTLKENTPILLLRNLNPPKLCNGTRLVIKKLHSYFLEAVIATGCGKGETVFVPRIPMVPTDSIVQFKRTQFPVKVCFAMTINKSQGQTLKTVGISLHEQVFSHGQLYVACSRVTSQNNLYIFENNKKALNVVYREALTSTPVTQPPL